jgi:hypothetical protein
VTGHQPIATLPDYNLSLRQSAAHATVAALHSATLPNRKCDLLRLCARIGYTPHHTSQHDPIGRKPSLSWRYFRDPTFANRPTQKS